MKMQYDDEEQYEDDLPMPINAEEEFFSMEKKMEVLIEKRSSLHHCLDSKACDHNDMYSNLHVLLRICTTIPVHYANANGRVVY